MNPYTPAKLFVYGSLRQGFFNHDKALVGKTLSRQSARVMGCLYHLTQKGYPALVPGSGWVTGELLELDNFAQTISVLDEIENYVPGRGENEYERILTPIYNFATGQKEQAYVYWYAANDLSSPGNEAVRVAGGDWQAFMLQQQYHNIHR